MLVRLVFLEGYREKENRGGDALGDGQGAAPREDSSPTAFSAKVGHHVGISGTLPAAGAKLCP